ncbi:MAG: DNA-directed DNA polymerase [Candidatus Aenigmatarchaeota archaeon]
MQILDVDYTLVNDMPVIRIFGKNEIGEVVCGFFERFLPYFYVIPKDGKKDEMIKFLEKLPFRPQKIESVKKFLPIGFSEDGIEMLKITLKNPATVSEMRDLIRKTDYCENVYEADILFKNRFMSDADIRGMGWVEIVSKPIRTATVRANKTVKITDIKRIDSLENVPFRYLSFDIEVVAKKGVPEPRDDPIIIISICFAPDYNKKKSVVLTTKRIEGDDVMVFIDERGMLESFVSIVNEYDPDIITGFNTNNFDIPYLLKRLEMNKITKNFGRCTEKPVFVREIARGENRVSMLGRISADSYKLVKKNFLLKRYGLGDVAKALLNEQKNDVAHSEIGKLWNGNKSDELKKLVDYARKDAELALKLLINKKLMEKYIELSKISGALLQDCLDSGETTRIDNILLREFNKDGFVIPCKPTFAVNGGEALKGGFVLTPVTGLHSKGLVLVLDFKSMYPSIFISYNICPTTLVRAETSVETTLTPSGSKFVTANVRQGIIPRILKMLIEERKKTKKLLRGERDVEIRRTLDAKQLAFKILANAFYGYTGYSKARIHVLDVASSVTACGRHLIQKVRDSVERNYKYKVIYGDTDSIMIKTDIEDLEEGLKRGREITEELNKELSGVLEMEFEKMFKSFLILTKKRYAAWRFERDGDTWNEKIEMKGIETVRRDWCELVSETMNRTIDVLLKKGDVKTSVEYFRSVMKDLEEMKIPLQKLVITKSVSKNPSSYVGMQPHIELLKKLQARNPGDAPGVGDRVGYVIIKGNQLLSKRTEDPDYVIAHNLQIDSTYYIENQLLPPIERIFSAMGISKSELAGKGRQVSILDAFKRNHKPESKAATFDGFVCSQCQKIHAAIPLAGKCDCGGELLLNAPEGHSKILAT